MSVTVKVKPNCVAYVHRTMGSMACCGKYADWYINGYPDFDKKPSRRAFCRDCVAKVLINLGDNIDAITFDVILVDKNAKD